MIQKIICKASIICMLLSIFSGSFVYEAYAEDKIRFNNITIEDGLSQGSVETIFQDSEGYLWFGTNDGLNRYNGYEFKVYKKEPNDENSLVNNYILDIKEDKNNNIWVATINGLSKIHKDRITITNYTDNPSKGNLSNVSVQSLLIGEDNSILVATADGLNKYDEEKDSFYRIYAGNEITHQYISSLEQDAEGNVWVGTDGGLNKIDGKDGKVTKYYADGGSNSIVNNIIYKVYYDKYGYIWVGTYEDGMSKINIATGEITNYQHNKLDEKSIVNDTVRNFLRDTDGNMWIATESGLSKFNEEDNNFTNYKNKVYDNTTLVNDNVFSLLEDRSGSIWVGTYSGVSKFNSGNKILYYNNDVYNDNSISSNMISGLYEEDDVLWVGTRAKGLNIIERNTDRIIRVNMDNSNISSNRIHDIVGNNKYIAIATNEGIDIIDKKTFTLENYSISQGIPHKNVRKVYFDREGLLWVGTDDGLCTIDIDKKLVTNYDKLLKMYSQEDNMIGDIIQDSKGNYWIGTYVQGGLIKLDKNKCFVKKYKYSSGENSISNDSVRTIKEDALGNIWIGTSLGLNRLDVESDKFKAITTDDGLANNTIYGILIDDNNNPWVSTNLGISKIDISNEKIINLDVNHGLQSNEFNGNAYYKNTKGEFIFGGIAGINIFHPEDISIINSEEKVVFNEFRVNGVLVDSIDNKVFSRTEKNISIKLFLPNFNSSKGTEFFYKIGGKEEEWLKLEGDSLNLTNLSAGNYTISVIGKKNDGTYTDISSITFKIKPYFLLSRCSIAIYSMIIIWLIYRSKRKVVILDKLVTDRTKELSLEMRKNEELFNKLIKLEKTKNNYFVNMSHELRTPLNVIHSIEQLITNLNASEKGIEKEKIDRYMGMLSNNVKRLLKIINDLIDTSKMENGNYNIILEDIDIVYTVEEAVLSLKNIIEEKDIELIIEPDIEEKIIEADKNQIERCIINIVSNAVKFTEKGGIISVYITDLNNEVVIEIEDNGKGIDKRYHKAIFDRFSQVVDEHSEVKGGSGLGLTITKQIVELHGGKIIVDSEIGVGSTFIIVLPVKQNK